MSLMNAFNNNTCKAWKLVFYTETKGFVDKKKKEKLKQKPKEIESCDITNK